MLYYLPSGLAEPIGALLGFAILMSFLNDVIFGILFASVAGIMVFISIDELLPAAYKYGETHLSIYGVDSRYSYYGSEPCTFCMNDMMKGPLFYGGKRTDH
jgi:zinc transporter ZupT